jgi:hypothetical protein
MKQEEYQIGNKVKVIKIINPDKVEHLESYIDKEGYLGNYIVLDGIYKYKVIFNEADQHYFRYDELEVIEKVDKLDTAVLDIADEDIVECDRLLTAIYKQQG